MTKTKDTDMDTKTLTIDELKTIDWTITADDTSGEFEIEERELWDDATEIIVTNWRAGHCTMAHDGIEITFDWLANGEPHSYESSFSYDITVAEYSELEVTGAVIVDEYGNPAERYDVLRAIELEVCWEDVVRKLLPKAETKDIDMDTTNNNDADEITVERDNGPALRFRGELMASASSDDNNASGRYYSGQAGRWCELRLYKTSGGKFVCSEIGRTRWSGEKDRYSAKVCETVEEVTEFFGYGWLAKELYAEAQIDASETVE